MPSPREILEYQLMSRGMEDAALRGVVARNMNKDFVQRIASANPNVSNSLKLGPNSSGTHLMASGDGRVFPMIERQGNKLVRRPRGKAPLETINMGGDIQAEWFGNNYKRTNPKGFMGWNRN